MANPYARIVAGIPAYTRALLRADLSQGSLLHLQGA